MGHLTNKLDKVLELYHEHPQQPFTVRAIARRIGIPKSSVQLYLRELRRQHFIDAENRAVPSLLFTTRKICYFLEKIVSCGLLDFLIKELNPSCIILFGSVRKGDSVAESDIDMFIESPVKKELDSRPFERRLHHPIQLFGERNIHAPPPQLLNNVVNGIKLQGSFRVK